MKVLLIVNPHAGKKLGATVADTAVDTLRNLKVETDVVYSEWPGHAVELARETELSNLDGLIAVGGDGTLFEIINGLVAGNGSIPIPLGQIPVGTGNSFLKDIEQGETDPIAAGVDRIAGGATVPVDLGKFTCDAGEYYFANLLGAGFVSNVAYRAKKYKAFGSLSYVFGVFEELIGLSSYQSTLIIDDTAIERDLIFIEICNSRYTGGNMMMAPSADISDGLLDVVVVDRITRRRLLKLFPRIFNGTHVEDESVEVIRGRHIRFESAVPLALTPDGETFGTTPIEVEVVPAAVRFFA